uniref:Uncharacterized protein n=1 Tax=Pseudomonas phage Cygsa01 TaxID=3138529 RepID=A0AAU6W393_9VIRU
MEIVIQSFDAEWHIDREKKKAWRLRVRGHVKGPDFITRFDLTKLEERASVLKFSEGRLFKVNMEPEDRKLLALEIKRYAERTLDEQLKIIVMSRPPV